MAVMGVQAQNANRGGFFLELGIGGTVGDVPRIGYRLDQNNDLYLLHAGGAKFDFAFGARATLGNPHWSYEFRIEAEAGTSHTLQSLAGKVYPIAFRYTSSELFGNMSLYATFGLGGAISGSGKDISDPDDSVIWLPDSDNKDAVVSTIFDTDVTGGPAYTLGVGLNVTTHLYAGVCWDAQMMFGSYHGLKKENLHYGSFGVRVGYRF